MKGKIVSALLLAGLTSMSAQAADRPSGIELANEYDIPRPAAIAHRGDSYHAPEATAPAFILAREQGADYFELDLQRTKDGVLIALHDVDLKRTTNVEEVFPERADESVNEFTLEELKMLDAGSWFNEEFPERARESYEGLEILTLEEAMEIAEGGDNQPGLYLETKEPQLFPGIERDLREALEENDWLEPRSSGNGDVDVASTGGHVILQTFEPDSFVLLSEEMPELPRVLLLWIGDGYIPEADLPPQQEGQSLDEYYRLWQPRSREDYYDWLDFAAEHGAIGVGPAAELVDGGEWSYMNMTQPWMNEAAHERGLLIHPYTIDETVDMGRIQAGGVDGMMSNDIRNLLKFYNRAPEESVDSILERYGY